MSDHLNPWVSSFYHRPGGRTRKDPDFRQWVGYGDRTVDEMAHAWVDVTYLEQEDFERQVAARAGRPAADQQDDNQ